MRCSGKWTFYLTLRENCCKKKKKDSIWEMYYVIPGKPWAWKKKKKNYCVCKCDWHRYTYCKQGSNRFSVSFRNWLGQPIAGPSNVSDRPYSHRLSHTHKLTHLYLCICVYNIICSSYNCVYTHSLYSIVSGTITAEGHNRWKRVDSRFRTRID